MTAIEGLSVDAWTDCDCSISIGRAKYGRGLNRNRRTHQSPRGAFRSVGSSSNGRRSWRGFIARSGPSNLSDLHRIAAIFCDRRQCVIARSSSDGHDTLRSSSHLGNAWSSLERPISIRSRSSSDGGKQDLIATRSWFDRNAIMALRHGDQVRSWS